MKNGTYLNFPIWLLRNAYSDIHKVCDNIIDYAVVKLANTLDGDIEHRLSSSAKYFGIKLGNNKRSQENGNRLISNTSAKSVITGISQEMLFDYFKNEKTEKEISLLLAHLAIKSILGKKSYCRINTDFLLCRMAGCGKKDELTELPPQLKKYYSRYHMDCLKSDLKQYFNLKIYGRYTRGIFVSFALTEEDLIRAVEMKRRKFITKEQRETTKKIVGKVLAELYPIGS
jgi:hypothetical protein